jgi:positive regulator of sigma E activity
MTIENFKPSVGAAVSTISQSRYQISDIIIVFLLQVLIFAIGYYIFEEYKRKSTTEEDESQQKD